MINFLLALPLLAGGSLVLTLIMVVILYGADLLLQYCTVLALTWTPTDPWSWTHLLQPWLMVPYGLQMLLPVLQAYQATTGLMLSVCYGSYALVGLVGLICVSLLLHARLMVVIAYATVAFYIRSYRLRAIAAVVEVMATLMVCSMTLPILLQRWTDDVHDIVGVLALTTAIMIIVMLAYLAPAKIAQAVTGIGYEKRISHANG